MAVPAIHRFSTGDYYRLAESGVLAPNARVELLDGVIHDMSPIGPFHGGVVARLVRIFVESAHGRWLVWAQNPLHLDEQSEPEPDLLLLRPAADDYTAHLPRPEDAFLLIEVADTSLAYDRQNKLPAYARAGIAEVWIVNLVHATLEIYRGPQPGNYSSVAVLGLGQAASPLAFPDVSVNISELLRH